MENILNKVFERHPIVHCITNYVTVNDVANVIIASGGSPRCRHARVRNVDYVSLCGILRDIRRCLYFARRSIRNSRNLPAFRTELHIP